MNRKELIFVLAITAIVIIIWVTSDIFHAQSTYTPDPRLDKITDEINPNFDPDALEKIKNASLPVEISESTPAAIVVTPTPTPTASASASPRVASSSATTNP